MDRMDLLEYLRTCKGVYEKGTILLATLFACALPIVGLLGYIEWAVGSWLLMAIMVYVHKRIKTKRTKEDMKISFVPKINV